MSRYIYILLYNYLLPIKTNNFVAITCPFLPDLVNGSLTYSDDRDQNESYAFNVVVTYSCDTGFSLVGISNRTCTGDGSSTTGAFNGAAPICQSEN